MRILVTGAAGLLGGELCKRLLEPGHGVTGLVHRNPTICGNDGHALAIDTLTGDISQPRFGWEAERFAEVAQAHDLLIHCAATVRFDLAEDDYRAVNVNGVSHALALAEAGGMDFLHISTAYVCGIRNGTISVNDALPGSGPGNGPENAPEIGFANGYEASKAAGERLVRASSVRWAIARPSIVVGDYETGAIRQFDTTYAAFKLIAEGRVRQMPARADGTLDFVPLDHVAQGIVLIAERMEDAAGGAYHLVSGQPLPVTAFADAIGSYPQFHEPRLVTPEEFDPASLQALERRLYKRVAGLYASYFQRDPHFSDTEFRKLSGRGCPPTGPAYIHRLIDHCIAVGFLPAA